ncbi:hypothetical protein GQX74_010697 [Glossina fuscipes]|nr:hypothetical protein GQX74_010697 [Glossina fuscipes]
MAKQHAPLPVCSVLTSIGIFLIQLSAICNSVVVSAIWGHQPRSRKERKLSQNKRIFAHISEKNKKEIYQNKKSSDFTITTYMLRVFAMLVDITNIRITQE